MTQALDALPYDGLPDEEDLQAGPPTLRAQIRIEDPAWVDSEPVSCAEMVLTVLSAHPTAPNHDATLEIVFASDAMIAKLNRTFRGKDGPTNVLAFPTREDPPTPPDRSTCDLGGIALAYGVMSREARERGIALEHHTTHLLLHGVLHLLGYDHETEPDRVAMERMEIDILHGLGIANPYRES